MTNWSWRGGVLELEDRDKRYETSDISRKHVELKVSPAALGRCLCDHPMMHQWRSIGQGFPSSPEDTFPKVLHGGSSDIFTHTHIYIYMQMHQMRFHDASEVGFHMLSLVCACACSVRAQFESMF